MEILLLAGFYDVGGFSTVMEKLANKLAKNGHNVTIAALMFKHFPSKGLYDVTKLPLSNCFKLIRFLKKFDIIHNHHPITNYLALISNRPFIYHYHGAPDSGKGALHRLNLFSSVKLTSRHLDAVITVSEAGESELKQHFEHDKINVVCNGVDTSLFQPNLEPKFRKGEPQFLFVGNLYEHKNLEEVIFAFKILSKVYPNALLQIIGNGTIYNQLKNLVTKLGLENYIELVGRVNSLELPYYYASCDVYITASRWEHFGLPILEAMACGKPVVASCIPAHQELIQKSNAGLLYKLGDERDLVTKMCEINASKRYYKNNALLFAKSNDWSIVTDQIMKIYSKLL
jgi:glycosyltransferase involved in cell wall biosynthesis